MELLYKKQELPLEDLDKLGLIKNGQLSLRPEDQIALLSGRRTDLIRIHQLTLEDFHIDELYAKLSVTPRIADNRPSLNIHPVFKEIQMHPLLIAEEAEGLKQNAFSHLKKTITDIPKESIVIEFDQQTREFVFYDPDTIISPTSIEEEKLTSIQREEFKMGHIIELKNGIRLQHRATVRTGLLANVSQLGIVFTAKDESVHTTITGIEGFWADRHTGGDGQYIGR
jgi:hypothetical protein